MVNFVVEGGIGVFADMHVGSAVEEDTFRDGFGSVV